ncbi:hypothetical protein HLB44_35685 [Aquincola sp. S2]|uniref:DUF202 domain-containing protein n=1 Tax=Pseudaquabacterium terrae TaxID=2732868 RepID=A0ABX2EUK3_9BURK|nr:hypothetical protein [Aquabacterium terrae]NRF72333.1 hypothetical protein [Aquabacterium terrae]
MEPWGKRMWRDVSSELFDNEGLDTLFSHARNMLTCAAIIAAGLYAAHHMGPQAALSLPNAHIAGYIVAGFGVAMLGLNLLDGLRRLAKRRHPLLLRALAIFVYVVLSVRLTQVIVYFRSAV